MAGGLFRDRTAASEAAFWSHRMPGDQVDTHARLVGAVPQPRRSSRSVRHRNGREAVDGHARPSRRGKSPAAHRLPRPPAAPLPSYSRSRAGSSSASVIVFPWMFTVWMSAFDWKIGSVAHFVGLDNYIKLLDQPPLPRSDRPHALLHRARGGVTADPGHAAALIFHREFPLRGVLRSIFTMPMMATPVAVALVWTMMFHPQQGVLNYLLSLVGLPPSLWVYSPTLVIPSLVLVEIWHWTPLVMLIVLGGPRRAADRAVRDRAARWCDRVADRSATSRCR